VCICEEIHLGGRKMATKSPDLRETTLVHACCEIKILSSDLGRFCMGTMEVGRMEVPLRRVYLAFCPEKWFDFE